nr:glycoside hydrolase family 3 N-terminal domain-containing protein [uncultured Friedmanniella sp.]
MTDPSAPYRDPSVPVEQRVEDLLGRMSLEDKAGLMFHDMAMIGPGGTLMESGNLISRPATAQAVRDLRMNHFNLLGSATSVRELVGWYNALQEVAAGTPLGIPVSLSTDPRHAASQNPGTAALSGAFSTWPESLGFAALRDPELVERFADIARQEYLAAGFRVALHPQVDLATEYRWARVGMTFGEDADLTSALVRAYVRGFQGERLGPESVATMTKHFPGGGPQLDGEDPHFGYGREQVYPGGQQEYHLAPFRAALAAGTSQIMPYYGMPIGTAWEEVGFAFNRPVIAGLLREELGFDGIVCTDWGLLTDKTFAGEPMPARAWGIEELTPAERLQRALDAGVDQFGGESCPELMLKLVRSGAVTEDRLDVSARRLLREKFVLGLFDADPLDLEHALATIGRQDFVAAGAAAQSAAITRLTAAGDGPAALPLADGLAVYVEGFGTDAASRLGRLVPDPADADLAVLRLQAPFEPRLGRFESFFHAGSLEYPPAELDRLLAVCAAVPTVVDLYLDRPAVVPELAASAAAFLVNFGATDDALIDVLTGRASARGRLPFDLPSSMAAVRASRSDVPFDTAEPLFRFGDGLLD